MLVYIDNSSHPFSQIPVTIYKLINSTLKHIKKKGSQTQEKENMVYIVAAKRCKFDPFHANLALISPWNHKFPTTTKECFQ